MIEAVIWDFGGVLTTSPFEAFTRFETERGLPADIIRRPVWYCAKRKMREPTGAFLDLSRPTEALCFTGNAGRTD
jgi:hypothetical protein